MAEQQGEDQPAEHVTAGADPEFESTHSKLERGALPPDDPLVRLQRVIDDLRSFAARL